MLAVANNNVTLNLTQREPTDMIYCAQTSLSPAKYFVSYYVTINNAADPMDANILKWDM
jgi:hypothetical protein